MPAAAAIVPAVIGAGTSIFQGISGRNAAKTAGTVQANNAAQTIDYTNNRLREGQTGIDAAAGTAADWTAPAADWAQQQMFPYMGSGTRANTTLDQLLQDPNQAQFSYDPSKVADDPGYQFTMQQGMKALEQSAAARGQSLSGGQLKAVSQFNQGNAATYENQFYNQALQTFNTNANQRQSRIANLFGLSSEGLQAGQYAGNVGIQQTEYASDAQQRAAQEKAALGMQAAGQVGNARTGAANSTAASILAANGSETNGIKSAGNDIGEAIFLSQALKKPPQSTYDYNPAVVRPGDDAQFGG